MARISKRRSSDSDDTIHVASRTTTPPASRMMVTRDDVEHPLVKQEHQDRLDMRVAMDVDSSAYAGKGKGRAAKSQSRETMDIDSDDDGSVEEYIFTSGDEANDEEDDLTDYDDAASHISLSSDDDHRHEVPDVSDRPWELLGLNGRKEYEFMFKNLTSWPMGGSWSFTEEYQHELDKQMLKYLATFPLREWLMPRPEAQQIYARFQERQKWRDLGTKIYGNHPQNHVPPMTYSRTMPPQGHRTSLPYNDQLTRGPPHPPPPQQTLPSQPYDRPMPVPPGVHMGQPTRHTMPFAQIRYDPHGNAPMPHAMAPNQPMHRVPNGMPPQHMPRGIPQGPYHPPPPPPPPPSQQYQMPDNLGRRPRPSNPAAPREESSPPRSPPPGVPVPPYAPRQKPDNRKTLSKIGRGKGRRAAEAEIFPWNRQMDFRQARIAAQSPNTWNLGIYDQETLDRINAVHARNAPIIVELEKVITEKQREQLRRRLQAKMQENADNPALSGLARSAKKSASTPEPSMAKSDEAVPKKGGRKRNTTEAPEANAGNDPNQSGNFAWATTDDQQRAANLRRTSPEDVINAGMNGQIKLNDMAGLMIVWNPGKKGSPPELEQATFSVRDTVLTREQLNNTPVLNHCAAECIIDFCPDLLWRDVLLRILSEGACSNKEIRERFLLNGSSSDRATVAKRLSAALGKDTNPPRGGPKAAGNEEEGGDDWHNGNRDDFDAYQAFFGKRPPARRSGKSTKKREADTENDESSPAKRQKSKQPSTATLMSTDDQADGKAAELNDTAGGGDQDQEMVDEADDDAVSVQNSDELDMMSD